jgi:hypothetical protein
MAGLGNVVEAIAEHPLLATSWPMLLLLGWLSYLVTRSIYRVFLSPIAHIPGPKLAAVTRWYEAYYEIALSGQYSFHINKLHDKYGITHLFRCSFFFFKKSRI